LEEDQRALKKQFGRKVSKLRQEAEDAMLAKNAALQEVNKFEGGGAPGSGREGA
jgi:hypothetical protein